MKAPERALYKKIIALLHDPPHKPWVVAGRRILTSQNECEGLKAHECESKYILNQLFGIDITSSPYSDIWKEAEELDRLSSSFDRWLFEYELAIKGNGERGEDKNKVLVQKEITLINPFDPRYEFGENCRPNLCEKDLKCYLNALKEILDELNKDNEKKVDVDVLKSKYYVLYALMEPLWYNVVNFPPPADTRFPTHTVFDHVYATASLSNVYSKGLWNGYLVYIDFLSVQKFVKEARGPADLWAGSWLISALAWKTVEELIDKIGPEILVTPTARYNPFYFNFLYVKLGCSDRSSLKLCKFLDSLKPEHPVMPPTMMLLLPKDLSELGIKNENSLKKYLLKRVSEAWKSLYLESLELALNNNVVAKYFLKDFRRGNADQYLDKEAKGKVLTCIKKIREGSLNDLRDCGIDNEKEPYLWYLLVTAYYPPVRPAVTVVDLKSAHNTYLREVRPKLLLELKKVLEKHGKVPDDGKLSKVIEKVFYHWLFTKYLKKVMFENKLIVNVGPAKPQVVAFTEKAFKEGIKSNAKPYRRCRCGLPAIVYRGEDLNVKSSVIRPHEALCPYCFTKRIIGYARSFDKPIKELIGRKLDISRTVYTIDLANLFNKKRKEVMGNATSIGELLESRTDEKERARILEGLFKYYGFLFADGDSIGELYHMRFGLPPKEYFKRVVRLPKGSEEESSSETEKKKDTYAELFELLVKELGVVQRKAEDMDECGKREDSDKGDDASTLLTPSIQAQISYSLMITSLIDQKIIEALGGVSVYLGGDDLVALIPLFGNMEIEERLKQLAEEYEVASNDLINEITRNESWKVYPGLVTWWLTRLNYWGMTGLHKGFLGIKLSSGKNKNTSLRAIAPALLAYGRKYGLYISHYREPIKLVYQEASDLESSGKNVKRKVENEEIRKDTIAIKSRSAEAVIVPQTLFATGEKWKANLTLGLNSLKMLRYFQDNERSKFSSNALRDAINLIESLKTDTTIGLLKRYEVNVKLALHALERNIQGRDKELPEDVKEILEQLKDEEIITKRNGELQEVEPVSLFLKFIQTWKGSKR